MVFYRKYRPQQIQDLDNLDVQQKLYSVLTSNTPHAFLFTGPKGLGKTSTARIIAKAVNCEKNIQNVILSGSEGSQKGAKNSIDSSATPQNDNTLVEPCNICDQCISITTGTNLDVLEIDAASNRGIDEIRDLKEKIRLSPVSSKKKVYIIDEVHMLTTEAFNALLKTLEEPPSHAMFILCTTELQKVPATIASRCFHINFKPATEEELVRSFTRIVKAENIAIDDDALKYIAGLSDRGFRDGVKILEEIVSLAGGKQITKELIESCYKTFNIALNVQVFLISVAEKDVKKSLGIVKELMDQGTDMKYFITSVLNMLHKILLLKVGVSDEYKNLLEMHVFDVKDIKILVDLFSKAYIDMKYSVLPQLPLELAVIEYAQNVIPTSHNVIPTVVEESHTTALQSKAVVGDLSTSVEMTKNTSVVVTKDEGVSVSSLRKQVGIIQKNKALYGEAPVVAEIKPELEISKVELMKALANGEVTKEWRDVFWRSILSEMKLHNHTIVGVLRGCTIRSYGDKQLIIETSYKFHKEKLDELQTRDTLAKVCKTLTGNDVTIQVELKSI